MGPMTGKVSGNTMTVERAGMGGNTMTTTYKLDGTIICRQTSPGEGWEKLDGRPFRDLNCSMPAARVERPTSVPGFRPQPGR